MISQYWIDQIPSRPLAIQVKNSAGEDMDLSGYTTITARMVGSRNEVIDLTGYSLNTLNKDIGKIIFIWPTAKSLFTEAGDYVLQLKLEASGKLDFTSTHTIRVRELGRVR